MNRSNALTLDEITSVKTSFDRMWPASATMVDQFYARLFEIAPDVKSLFRNDMTKLKSKFISTLAIIVGSLDEATGLLSVVGKLARDHVHYGVEVRHYAAIEEALLWSLAQGLGPFWTQDVELSWRKLYGFISTRMIEAAYR